MTPRRHMVIGVLALLGLASSGAAQDLLAAAQAGETSPVLALLEGGADVNRTDGDGLTALMAASAGGHVSTVRTLLGWGADVRAASKSGLTALMLAAMGGHADVVELLIPNSDLDAENTDGLTAYSLALAAGYSKTASMLMPSLDSFSESEEVSAVLQILVREDAADINNQERIPIADVSIGNRGGVRLKVLRDRPKIERLRTALEELETLPHLTLPVHSITVVDGERRSVHGSVVVRPGDPDYGHAVAEYLGLRYGLRAEVTRPPW